MAWASTADVVEVTGASVDPAVLAQADGMVTVYCNRTPEASAGMGERDLYWLRQATCWQARWLSQQVGVDGRSSHTSLGQDGLTVTHDAEHQIVLAPLAARSLKNLSWKGTRTVRTAPVYSTGDWADRFLEEAADEHHSWEPL